MALGVDRVMVELVVSAEVEVVSTVNRWTTAPRVCLMLLHGVLKWLHHPLLKNVMLWHAASAWHDVLHSSRLGSFPGDVGRYFSPAFASQEPLPTSTHTTVKVVSESGKNGVCC